MRIELQKFGKLLISRPAGREAWLVAQAYLLSHEDKNIEVDFSGVTVLTPSWAGEFLVPLKEKYPNGVTLLPYTNSSVRETVNFLHL